MKNCIKLAIFCLFILTLSACGRPHMMPRADMYLVPSVSEMPDKFVVIISILDPVLDIAEGGQGRVSWKSVIVNSKGEKEDYIAVSLGIREESGKKILLTIVPKTIDEIRGSYFYVLDHGGLNIYNNLGESMKLKSRSKKIKLSDYVEFLMPIEGVNPFVKIASRNSEEFKFLKKGFGAFRTRDLELAREYVYKKYGTNLSEEELENIASEDSIVRGFADWLGRDWKLFLVYPFTSVGNAALLSGVVKVFTIPSIWGDKINKPGYMEYITDAETTAQMSLRAIQEYGPLLMNHK
ncbi:hypothetical protein C0584_02120 [Candidatus Parcubacteria bacterium]|nr:MAG: hypothetical protein C0584_02120 [Candidatus Parcubacteria bacterium]